MATFNTNTTRVHETATVSDQSSINSDGEITIKMARKLRDMDGTRHYMYEDIRMTTEQWLEVARLVSALIDAPKDMDGWAFAHNLEREVA